MSDLWTSRSFESDLFTESVKPIHKNRSERYLFIYLINFLYKNTYKSKYTQLQLKTEFNNNNQTINVLSGIFFIIQEIFIQIYKHPQENIRIKKTLVCKVR